MPATNYSAFDRFGRTLRQKWKKSSTVHDQTDYTYDYAGNRLARDVDGTTTYDQTYTYDELPILKIVAALRAVARDADLTLRLYT